MANSFEQRVESSGSVASGLVFYQRSKEYVLNKDLRNCVRFTFVPKPICKECLCLVLLFVSVMKSKGKLSHLWIILRGPQ